MKTLPTLSAATVSLLLVSAQAQAQDILVTRCNVNVNSSFVPALIYSVAGERKVIVMGEAGLTRQVVFNEDAALAFVSAQIGQTSGKLVYVDCTSQAGDGTDVTPPAPPLPPVDPGDDSPPGGGDYGYLE